MTRAKIPKTNYVSTTIEKTNNVKTQCSCSDHDDVAMTWVSLYWLQSVLYHQYHQYHRTTYLLM